jgi:CubicO group peptidase (beta-lactamase class C family)
VGEARGEHEPVGDTGVVDEIVTGDPAVSGYCAPGFEGVRATFTANFVEHGELGAAVTVMVGGRRVVDLWGGWADLARTQRWQPDTLVNVYSVGKAVVAVLLLQLVQDGLVGLDDPVAGCWPEFAAHGKQDVTLRHVLCHQAGVPAIRAPLRNEDLWDFDRMCAAIAATEPWWPAGRRLAYHTNTYGHLVGGVIRQLTGDLPGTRLRAVADAIGADLHFGVPDEAQDRCAEVHFDQPMASSIDPDAPGLDGDARMTLLGYANPPGYSSIGVVNTPEWRRAQVPSTNGHMTARGVAGFYEAIRRGDLLAPDILAEAVRPQSSGFCPTLGQDVTFGLGFQPWSLNRPIGRSPAAFGHFGTGGALGFADPSAGLAFGYVMNHVIPRWQSPRNRALVDAVYAALASA